MPVKQPADGRELDIDSRTRNALQRSLRCLGERGFALLTQRWRTLQHVTASPSKIGDIARAALVLTHFEHAYIPWIHHSAAWGSGPGRSRLKQTLDYHPPGEHTQAHA
jgi:hypothetical protein